MRQTCWWWSLVLLVSFSTEAVADLAPNTAKSVREVLTVGFEPFASTQLHDSSNCFWF